MWDSFIDGGVVIKTVWLVSSEVTPQWWQTVGGGWGTFERSVGFI